MDYRFNVFYYRGSDKKADSDNEIGLIIEEDGFLYPWEIKMTGNPKAEIGQYTLSWIKSVIRSVEWE